MHAHLYYTFKRCKFFNVLNLNFSIYRWEVVSKLSQNFRQLPDSFTVI